MDIQFVSDLMTQFNNNHPIPTLQGNNNQSTNNFIDPDLVGNESINIVPNKVPPKLNIPNNGANGMMNNGSNSGPNMRANGNIQNIPNNVNMNTNNRVPASSGGNNPNLNQIPRNLSNAPRPMLGPNNGSRPEGAPKPEGTSRPTPNVAPNFSQNQNIDNQLQGGADIQSSDFYSIFGFQLSKTTVYIIIGFVAIIAIYYIYKYFMSSSTTDKDSKKRKPEVSYDQQMNQQMQDQTGNDE